MSVKLTLNHLETIRQHARTFPGRVRRPVAGVVENGERVIRDVLPLENIRKDSRHNRVELSRWITPRPSAKPPNAIWAFGAITIRIRIIRRFLRALIWITRRLWNGRI